jgi:hypothetical protein
MPKNWNYQLWINETSVDKTFFGQKSRSDRLTAVDQAMSTYGTASAFHKLKALHRLWDAYDVWAGSKNDVANSIRDKRDVKFDGGTLLTDFSKWLAAREDALMPAPEMGWKGAPNCYAYAMKCKQIIGNAPTPGAAAGKPVLPFDPRWMAPMQKIRYHAMLLDGIVADARACGKVVEILREPAEGDYPTPINPPTERCNGAHYLAAMVAKSDGFHFMRRDSTTRLWSQKNGGGDAEVDTSAILLATGVQRGPRQTPITDAVAVELLQCTEGKYIAFSNFRFVGYVLVPHAGITVKGAF